MGDCAEHGFATVSAAWERYTTDPMFERRVQLVRHQVEHLVWPDGDDGLEKMLACVISVALNVADEMPRRLLSVTAARSAAEVLRDASGWVPDPASAIMLGSRADAYERAEQRMRTQR
jgi:hypothetical protein